MDSMSNTIQELDIERLRAETQRIQVEIEHRFADTELARKKTRWYEVVLIVSGTAGVLTLGIAIARLFQIT